MTAVTPAVLAITTVPVPISPALLASLSAVMAAIVAPVEAIIASVMAPLCPIIPVVLALLPAGLIIIAVAILNGLGVRRSLNLRAREGSG
ncbi:hypothetical protein [Rhizobium herbae]